MSSLNAWAQRFSVIRDQIRCLIIVWFFYNPACKCFPQFSLVCIVWLLISSFLKPFHSKSPRFRRLITNHHFYVRVILCFGFYVAFTDLWPFVGRALLTLSVFHVCALVKLHVWGQHPALLGISRLYLTDHSLICVCLEGTESSAQLLWVLKPFPPETSFYQKTTQSAQKHWFNTVFIHVFKHSETFYHKDKVEASPPPQPLITLR